VGWQRAVNRLLTRTTGYELRRATRRRPRVGVLRPGDRLVPDPVFILCSLRSGSTLLRMLLDSHSKIHAPHELHLRYMSVKLDNKWSEVSAREMGLGEEDLRNLLWDRVLHRELSSSGKSMIVEKTPNNVFIADQLRKTWPDCKFIFLLRHPGAILRSRQAVLGEGEKVERNVRLIRRYCDAIETARSTHPGHTVRYEDLVADPAKELKAICSFLGVSYEPRMLDYGRFDHGRFRAGLGDWHDKIRSGQVQTAPPPPAAREIPEALRPACAAWGYQ
jgi:Sulfotransferase family